MKDIILALISDFSWPFVVIVAMIAFRRQLGFIVGRLSSFKAGSVELQLFQQLSSQELTSEQKSQLSNLTTDELDLFLLVSFSENIGFSYQTPIPNHVFKRRMESLKNAGLIDILNPENDGTGIQQGLQIWASM